MKRILSLALLLSFTTGAFAVEEEINGLWYELASETKEATVIKYKNDVKYSGDIVIPPAVEYNGDSYNVTSIGDHAFLECSDLASITIPSSVKSIETYAFSFCSGLKSITIPNSVTSIESNAFSFCSSLTSVKLPDSLTSIENFVFFFCGSLTSITIPDSVTSIGERVFVFCTSLTSVTIPDNVTSIGELVFEFCSSLTSVTIGSGMKIIGSKAFAYCTKLTDVYCYAEQVPCMEDQYSNPCTDAFEGSINDNTTLHVPAASINAYQAVEPWKSFKNIVGLAEKGDVNSDGSVDVADIANVIDVMAGGSGIANPLQQAADVNQDGAVDVADISTIIDIMAGK